MDEAIIIEQQWVVTLEVSAAKLALPEDVYKAAKRYLTQYIIPHNKNDNVYRANMIVMYRYRADRMSCWRWVPMGGDIQPRSYTSKHPHHMNDNKLQELIRRKNTDVVLVVRII